MKIPGQQGAGWPCRDVLHTRFQSWQLTVNHILDECKLKSFAANRENMILRGYIIGGWPYQGKFAFGARSKAPDFPGLLRADFAPDGKASGVFTSTSSR